MTYLKITLVNEQKKTASLKLQQVNEGLPSDDVRDALRQLAKLNCLAYSNGEPLCTKFIQIKAEYITETINPTITVDLA
ncbi:hypothetical protein JOC36_001546 [Weissella uvarum]|uniref:DUF2922 family protein n=1 Tax=Weissella uvarum TaxID=1479233 RepID=UPI00195FEEDB|nr:hypothetical protein [Weissella uvarum]MBM7617952.1 hypothetical protein [Weissella uvarum]MCM0596171.1 hypothetical protein [Weissella uvarum]